MCKVAVEWKKIVFRNLFRETDLVHEGQTRGTNLVDFEVRYMYRAYFSNLLNFMVGNETRLSFPGRGGNRTV